MSAVREAIERAGRVAQALGALFAETRIPVIAVSEKGDLIAANRAAIAQYGWPLDELLTMNVRDLQAVTRSELGEDIEHVLRHDNTPLDRRPHRRRDGTVLWVVPTAHTTIFEGDRIVVSVLEDVTAVLEAETSARDVAERSLSDRQLVLNAIAAMIGERDSSSALRSLGRALSQAIGRGTTVWLPPRKGARVLHPVAWHALSDEGARTIESKRIDLDRERFGRLAWDTGVGYAIEPDAAISGSAEETLMQRFGSIVIVAPLMGRNGPHGLMYGLMRQTSDASRAVTLATTLGAFAGLVLESSLLEQRAEVMWHAASERLTDGIALLDAELRVARVNSAERQLLGLRNDDEVVGKMCREVFQICRDTDRCAHRIALEERRRSVREVTGTDSGRPMRIEIIPVDDDDANIAVLHVVHDLTEERAVRSQLVSSDRLASIGRLAAGVAHEINNPAAFVTVNLGVLRDRFVAGNARPHDVLAMLDESLNGMDRIREIVRDLKGLARDRAVEVVELGAVAQSAIRMATHETRGRARVERSTDEGAIVRARGARIAQVVLNLVLNAAQALPSGRAENRIAVRVRRVDDRARIEIADNGPGIEPAIARQIFEPFFTTREGTGGTGLGLWIARGIVEEEGGTLTFHDEPGGGACFTIDLPAAPPAEERESSRNLSGRP